MSDLPMKSTVKSSIIKRQGETGSTSNSVLNTPLSTKSSNKKRRRWVTRLQRVLKRVGEKTRVHFTPPITSFIRSLVTWFRSDMVAKSLALLIACVLWFVIKTLPNTITQRTLTLPLYVDGLQEGQLGRGIPETVEISISGPSERVNNLKHEQLRASLVLDGAQGEFRVPIDVLPPRDVTVLEIIPKEVAGQVEIRQKQDKLVHSQVLQDTPGVHIYATTTPEYVSIFGYDDAVDNVAWVTALVTQVDSVTENTSVDVPVHAFDSEGTLLRDINIVPQQVTVHLKPQPTLEITNLPIKLVLDNLSPELRIRYQQLSHAMVLVGADKANSIAAMLALREVTAQVDLAAYQAGIYTNIKVTPVLPEGVLLLSNSLSLDLELEPKDNGDVQLER